MMKNKPDGRFIISKKRVRLAFYIERILRKGENKNLGNRNEYRKQDAAYLVNLLSRISDI